MLNKRWANLIVVSLGMSLAGFWLAGCETESEPDRLEVVPPSASLYITASQQFVARGSHDYRWSLSDPSLGYLSPPNGVPVGDDSYILYFNLGPLNSKQTITVSGSAGGAAAGTDAASSETVVATVYSLGPGAVAIAPTAVSLTNGGSQVFSASGGDGENYSWSLSNPSLGALSSSSGPSVTYANTAGLAPNDIQTITVSSAGLAASANVNTRVP